MFQFLNRFYDVQYALLADRNDIINSDVILWGGDQVFSENIFRTMFVNIFKATRHLKHVIFGASFGVVPLGQNVKSFLNFFRTKQNSMCMTRELNDYAQQLFKSKHFTVIDPALIKSKDDWLSCINDTSCKKDYVFGYAPYNSEDQKIKYEQIGKQLRIDINIVKDNNGVNKYDDLTYITSFLKLIKNAKTVYTQSFHCFLFSVLFNKQIKFYDDSFMSNPRISSFIEKYNIVLDADGYIQNHDDVMKKIDEDRHKSLLCLYDSIFYRIESYVASSMLNTNKCSSGGISMALANEVISSGGCVYGVAWKNQWETEYVCIDSMNDYNKIAGSKYIQAPPPDFKEIKQKLDAKKNVMLVGTPCLIRAFQQYIFFKEYPNLLLVDLLCSGIFSVEKHKEIVDEALTLHDWNQSDVVDIKHRWKDGAVYGGNINVFHKNGQVIKIFENGEQFGKAKFENSLKMCFECPCGTHRQVKNVHYSDITVGDAWGIPENKNSSLSKVIINSKHGLKFFDKIKYMIWFKKLPVEYVTSVY